MIFINLGYSIMNMAYTNNFDITLLLVGLGSSFVPFVSTITVIILSSNIPTEVTAFISTITFIISVVQIFLITMFLLQTVKNIIWQPDV